MQKSNNNNHPDDELTNALINGDIDGLENALQQNANHNLQIQGGISPLIMAAFFGLKSIVEILLKKGVNPNQQTEDGQSALYTAARFGHKDVVYLLIEHTLVNYV